MCQLIQFTLYLFLYIFLISDRICPLIKCPNVCYFGSVLDENGCRTCNCKTGNYLLHFVTWSVRNLISITVNLRTHALKTMIWILIGCLDSSWCFYVCSSIRMYLIVMSFKIIMTDDGFHWGSRNWSPYRSTIGFPGVIVAQSLIFRT